MFFDSKIKHLSDGRTMLNLGCGTKMHKLWNNLDFSPYARLVRHKWLARCLKNLGLLSNDRYRRLQKIDPDIIYWDLCNGIPFRNQTFDVVYHSHFLEHIDRFEAHDLLKECYRILKINGVLRVVVPDLEALVKNYTKFLERLKIGDYNSIENHERNINKLFEQMVRKKSVGVSKRRGIFGRIEKMIRGEAEKTGELHKWMYDEFSLKSALVKVGFVDITRQDKDISFIKGWNKFKLDREDKGSEYKPASLYVESRRQ